MASQDSSRPSNDARKKSKQTELRIILLACGHGDTLLIASPGGRWSLVDCHLKNKGIRNQFFEIVEREHITRLDYLFLTHPHRDHCLGMTDVVRYFTSDGREIGTFCDASASHVDVIKLLDACGHPRHHVQPYVDLVRCLSKLIEAQIISYQVLHDRVYPLPVPVPSGPSRFIPIGPASGLVSHLTRQALEGVNVRGQTNMISLVILLLARLDDATCHVLLAGDADSDELEKALKIWRDHPENDNKKVHLDIIKVPHHGSPTGRSEQLVKTKREKAPAVAAISVDTLYQLPKADVIKTYHDAGWTVVATTTRRPPDSPNHPISAFARGDPQDSVIHRETVEVSWSAETGKITWIPEDAEIRPEDRDRYPT